jgi:membrane-associated phospholipid phosphatase
MPCGERRGKPRAERLVKRRAPAWYLDVYFASGVAVLALGIWLFHTLVEDVLERDPMVSWDAAAAAWVHAQTAPGGVRFFTAITHLGSATAAWTIAALGVPLLRRRVVLLTVWAAAFVGAAILEQVLKRAVQRPRPPADISYVQSESYSFPSGHALKGFVCYAMVAFVTCRLAGLRGVRRAAVYSAAGALVAAIGWSRIYLGAHYPSDIFAAFAVGGAWLAVCFVGVRLAERRLESAKRRASGGKAP